MDNSSSVPAPEANSPLNPSAIESDLPPIVIASATRERRARDEARPSAIDLRLRVIQPEVVAELIKFESADERSAWALNALQIGTMALRSAAGLVDGVAMAEAGQKLMSDVREMLLARGTELTNQMAQSLSAYLDPKTGALPLRLDGLLKKDGELDRIFSANVGTEDSMLARSLAKHLGKDSAIFKLLSPTDASGLKAQVEKALEAALTAQRQEILRQFSLDAKDSALSRLVAEVSAKHTEFTSELKGDLGKVVAEFSLDNEDGALNRLVGQVERAQKRITDEFTTDNEQSALSRMSKLLTETNTRIQQNLSLDDEKSALSRMRRELLGTLTEMNQSNTTFQQAVLLAVDSLQKKKAHDAKTPAHGKSFEEALGAYLAIEGKRTGDLLEPTGNTTGAIKNCKRGDFVLELSADSRAAGARIVLEAKDKVGVSLKAGLEELDEAMKNREAQLGIFVYGRAVAPEGMEPIERYGNRLLVVWDSEDETTDVWVKAAVSICRAVAVQEAEASEGLADVVGEIQAATRSIEKQAGFIEEIERSANTSATSAERILKRAGTMRAELAKQIDALDDAVQALKAE